MRDSNQEIAKQSAARLREWIASVDTIPLWRGRPNRTKILMALGIPRSTVQSNPSLRLIFADLDAQYCGSSTSTPSSPSRRDDLLEILSESREEIASLKKRLAIFEFLLSISKEEK